MVVISEVGDLVFLGVLTLLVEREGTDIFFGVLTPLVVEREGLSWSGRGDVLFI